jgi:hypothetical protein
MDPKISRNFEFVRNWDALPDDAVVPTRIAAFFLGVSDKTVRNHPHLTKVWVSEDRCGFRVGQLRQIARGEMEQLIKETAA